MLCNTASTNVKKNTLRFKCISVAGMFHGGSHIRVLLHFFSAKRGQDSETSSIKCVQM